jgi:hypothetical protein
MHASPSIAMQVQPIAAKGDQICQNATLHQDEPCPSHIAGPDGLPEEITRLTPGACSVRQMYKLAYPAYAGCLSSVRQNCARNVSDGIAQVQSHEGGHPFAYASGTIAADDC